MSLWRREAVRCFPELHREIADAEGPLFVWMAIRHALFYPAYTKDPPDLNTVARIYDYAAWCLKQHNSEIRLSVIDNFYEYLIDDERIRRDMPRWISLQTFEMLQFVWMYNSKQPFADLKREFTGNKARIEQERERGLAPLTGSRSKR